MAGHPDGVLRHGAHQDAGADRHEGGPQPRRLRRDEQLDLPDLREAPPKPLQRLHEKREIRPARGPGDLHVGRRQAAPSQLHEGVPVARALLQFPGAHAPQGHEGPPEIAPGPHHGAAPRGRGHALHEEKSRRHRRDVARRLPGGRPGPHRRPLASQRLRHPRFRRSLHGRQDRLSALRGDQGLAPALGDASLLPPPQGNRSRTARSSTWPRR